MANPSLVFIVGAKDETGAVLAGVTAHMDKMKAQAKETGNAFEGMGSTLRNALGAVGIGFSMGAVVSQVKEMINTSVELGMEIGHLSEKTGISTETLSGLKYVSDMTGVSFESLQRASKKLSTEMLGVEENSKPSIATFARLGIAQDEVRQHSNDLYGMLEIIANKFQVLPDGPQKAAIAVQLFGKTGMDLIPILDQGSAGLAKMKAEAESLGLVLDSAGIAKLQEMHRAGVELDGAMQGLAISLTNSLGPSLIGAATLIEKLIEKARQLKGLGGDSNTSGYVGFIPQSTYGLTGKDLNAAGGKATDAAGSAQASLTELNARHDKGLVSLKDYQTKKLALEREYYAQSQAAAAAAFLIQQDRAALLKADSANLQKLHPITSGYGAGGDILVKNAQDINTATGLMHKYGEAMKDASEKAAELDKKPGKGLILQDPGAAEAARKAAEAKLKADEAALNQLKISGDMTAKAEYEFWAKRIDAFKKGSDQYDAILQKQASLAAAGARTAHSEIEKFKKNELEEDKPEPIDRTMPSMADWVTKQQLDALNKKRDFQKRDASTSEDSITQREVTGAINPRTADADMQAQHQQEIVQLQALAAEYLKLGPAGFDAYAEIQHEITSTMEETQKQARLVSQEMQSLAHSAIDPLIEGTGTLGKRWLEVGQNIRKALEQAMDKEIVSMIVGSNDMPGGGKGKSSAGQGGAAAGILGLVGGLFRGKGAGAVKGAISGGGNAPVVQIINQSSQPVGGTATSSTGNITDSLRGPVIQIILEDIERGGTVGQILGGGLGLMS